jgi:hypothetical protein
MSVQKRFVALAIALFVGLVTAVTIGLSSPGSSAAGTRPAPQQATLSASARPTAAVPAPAHSRPAKPASRSLSRPPVATPGPVVIRVITVSSVANAQSEVNRCAGPVEVNYSSYGLPNDIVQHNYCGGSRFASLATGTHVTIIGGAHPGTYVVNANKRYIYHGQNVGVLAGIGDLALQTCVDGGKMAFVGLTRV